MPPYTWLHLENLWWFLAGGTLFAVAIILARGSTAMSFTFRRRSDEEIENDAHEFADGIKEHNHPIPIFIWMVALGLLVWSVAYTLFSGTHGL